MAKELTCRSFVLMPERGAVPVEELSPEERAAWHASLRQRLGLELGAFYAQHPELAGE